MLDVAVIGGGVAGCYCAYRLAGSDGRQVGLFEASGRIGGRLWSAPLRGGGFAEIGGMFFRENHRSVRWLAAHLGMATSPVDFVRAGQFVRGRSFQDADFQSDALPFALADDERTSGPAALLAHALEKLAPGATSQWPINRAEPCSAQATFVFLRSVRHRGRPLHEFSLWNVLADVISTEAYALLAATLGSASLIRVVNAFDGVWSLLHELGDGPGFRLVEGYQRLPLELLGRAEAAGAGVHFRHRLSALARRGGIFSLSFAVDGGAAIEVQARQVILALPQHALQQVAFDDALFDGTGAFARMRDRAVRPMRSCKVFLLYDRASWPDEAPDAIAARYTDMPMQQGYYFGRSAHDQRSVVMAYADDISSTFWSSLAGGEGSFPSAASEAADADALRASQALVQSLQAQFSALHGCEIASPSSALYFDWSSDPYGGAWHAWAPHFKSWDIRPKMRQPNPSLGLFICGEAYSQRNGWVEGAINSAERTLERLGLSRPGWICDPDFQFEIDDEGAANDDSNDRHVQRPVTRHGAAA